MLIKKQYQIEELCEDRLYHYFLLEQTKEIGEWNLKTESSISTVEAADGQFVAGIAANIINGLEKELNGENIRKICFSLKVPYVRRGIELVAEKNIICVVGDSKEEISDKISKAKTEVYNRS